MMSNSNLSNSQGDNSNRSLYAGAMILIFAAAIGFYASTAKYGFVYDDHVIVTEEKSIQDLSPAGIKHIFLTHNYQNYLPVRMLAYGAVYKFFGLDPEKFHLLNIVLNAANCLLLFLVCMALLKLGAPGKDSAPAGENARIAISFIAAILFLVHPVHVESVAWISGLKELLSSFFSLLALLFFIHLRAGGKNKPPSWAFHFVITLFILATLSKATAVFLPFAFLIFDFIYPSIARRSSFIQRALEYLFIFSALAIIVVLNYALSTKHELIMPLNGGGRASHILTIFKLFAFYIKTVVLPTKLSIIYNIAPASKAFSPKLAAILLGCFAYAAAFFYFLRKKPVVSFGLGYFAVAILPTLNVVPISILAADRYAYQPLAGLCIAFAAFVGSLSTESAMKKNAATAVCAAVIAALCVISLHRIPVWKNDYALWGATLKRLPNSPRAIISMGDAHTLDKKCDKALEYYRKAIKIDPAATKAYVGSAWCYREKGDLQKAFFTIKEGLRRDIYNMELYYYFGIILYDTGETESAARLFSMIEMEMPNYRETRQYLITAIRIMKNNMPEDEFKKTMKRLKPPKYIKY